MKNIVKKLFVSIIIAGLCAVAIYHLLFVLSYYIEDFFNGIEMEDGIPFYMLISLIVFIVLFVVSIKRKSKISYYLGTIFLSIFISCFAIMLSFDAEFISVNGVYITKSGGKYGVYSKWGQEIIPCQFKKVSVFYNFDNKYDTQDRVSVFGKDDSYYIATKDGLLLPTDRWEWVTPDDDLIIYGYITCVGDKFNLINLYGEKVLPEDFDEYVKYPYSSYLWVSVNGRWNVYDVTSNNLDKIANVDFDECRATTDGMLLKDGDDIILARTDQGEMTFFNLSEQERIENQNRQNAILLIMLWNQINNNNYQYSQMNNLYQNYNIHTRSRETIEAEIQKYEKEKAYCESNLGDGIATDMGYSGIISRYDNMIQNRKQELMMSN